jgi:hypothetical protein
MIHEACEDEPQLHRRMQDQDLRSHDDFNDSLLKVKSRKRFSQGQQRKHMLTVSQELRVVLNKFALLIEQISGQHSPQTLTIANGTNSPRHNILTLESLICIEEVLQGSSF